MEHISSGQELHQTHHPKNKDNNLHRSHETRENAANFLIKARDQLKALMILHQVDQREPRIGDTNSDTKSTYVEESSPDRSKKSSGPTDNYKPSTSSPLAQSFLDESLLLTDEEGNLTSLFDTSFVMSEEHELDSVSSDAEEFESCFHVQK